MNLDESDPTKRIVYADLTAGTVALPSGHVFAAGDLKLRYPNGTVVNATNLPTPAGMATGTFVIQLDRSEVQQVGGTLVQVASGTVDKWSVVVDVDHPAMFSDDSRLVNLDAAISSRARPADVPTALTVAGQVDTTLTAAHGAGTWQQGNTTVPPSAALIAAAVWQLVRAGNQPAGSFGEYIDSKISAAGGAGGGAPDPSAFAAAVWDQLRAGHQTPGTFGEFMDEAISAGGSNITIDYNTIATLTAAGVLAGLMRPAASSVPIVGIASYDLNDLEPPMPMKVPFDGVNSTLNLAVSIAMRWKRPDNSVVIVPLVNADPVNRVVQRVWSAGDLAQAGIHQGEVMITWPNLRVETVQQIYQWTVRAPLA